MVWTLKTLGEPASYMLRPWTIPHHIKLLCEAAATARLAHTFDESLAILAGRP